MCCCYQVFFCIVLGTFAIGTIAPNLESVGTARGAAYMIWELIDRVCAIMRMLSFGSLDGNLLLLHHIVDENNLSL